MFVSAARFLFFGAILSVIVNFTIVKIDLQIGLVEGDVLVHSNIAQHRGNTRGSMSVGGPRSLQRLLDLQGLQYLSRGIAGENLHVWSLVPV